MPTSIKEIKSILKEVATSQKRTDAQSKKTDAQLAETDFRIRKLEKLFGNVQNNQGEMVEEFFYNSLKEKMEVICIRYDSIACNVKPPANPDNEEYGIVMVNGDQILVIELKLKVHPRILKN